MVAWVRAGVLARRRNEGLARADGVDARARLLPCVRVCCRFVCTTWSCFNAPRPKRVHTPPINKNFLLRMVRETDVHNENRLYDEHFRSKRQLEELEARRYEEPTRVRVRGLGF